MLTRAGGNWFERGSFLGSESLEMKRWSRRDDRRLQAIRLDGSKPQEDLLLFGQIHADSITAFHFVPLVLGQRR